MSYDRRDYKNLVEAANANSRDRIAALQVNITKAPVDPLHLTGTASWDAFVQEVTNRIAATEAAKVVIQAQHASEPIFNHDGLLRLKLQAMLLEERSKTLSEVLELPKFLSV